jgi:hypothetical protein
MYPISEILEAFTEGVRDLFREAMDLYSRKFIEICEAYDRSTHSSMQVPTLQRQNANQASSEQSLGHDEVDLTETPPRPPRPPRPPPRTASEISTTALVSETTTEVYKQLACAFEIWFICLIDSKCAPRFCQSR